MSELNLNQIQERLNKLFLTYGDRKLVFWFDPLHEFEEDIDNGNIVLESAQIKKIDPHTQFLTKRFFEIEDIENNYLIYAPFKKIEDDDQNNHLLSLIKYSTLFSADRTALLMTQLNISMDLYDLMNHYSKFFRAKSRINSFGKLEPNGVHSKEKLEMTILAVLTKTNTVQFYSILESVLVDHAIENDELYSQIINYGLENIFWEYIEKYYGYVADNPTIQKLTIALFANAFYGQLGYQDLPISLKQYEIREQTTAIISFMDSFMNDTRYIEYFNKLSKETYLTIKGDKLLSQAPVEELITADVFEEIHQKILGYYVGQLIGGDLTPMIGGLTLSQVVTQKIRSHFGEKYTPQYKALVHGQELLTYGMQSNMTDFKEIIENYESYSYLQDYHYRKFIWYMDQVEDRDKYIELVKLIENKYKEFLNDFSLLWNKELTLTTRPSMIDFYERYGKNKIKTVMIISDALRYEVAKELQNILQDEKKYNTQMETIFSPLPSVTEFGKAASLRSGDQQLEYISGTDIRLEGMKTNGTENRDKILNLKKRNAIAVTYDEVIAKENAKELREMFNGQEVIYLYHDQIDKIGDHGQESQVFEGVQRTIDELKSLLTRISNGANIYRFIITSDHGFIYTRSKPEEHEKIENPSENEEDRVERRFIISKNKYDEIGIGTIRLGEILRNEDQRFVHYPETTSIFKRAGGGQNYVHGGSSPQEMLVPVLEVTISRGKSLKEKVKIQLTSPRRKIVGLSASLEFYQTEAISDSVEKEKFSLFFEDNNGNRVSNENTYFADSISQSAADRFSIFTFDFINRSYSVNEKVNLIIKNADTQIESDRIEFVIDNPFAGSFDFDI